MTGISSPTPPINHPARLAERVSMLDQLSCGGIAIANGCGAGSYETLAFISNLKDMTKTMAVWDDVASGLAKMWAQDVYDGRDSKHWSLTPRKVRPRPWKAPHPPMWDAAGHVSSWAAGHKGLGVLGFSTYNLRTARKAVAACKTAVKAAKLFCAYTNDYLMAVAFCSLSHDCDNDISWTTGPEYACNVSLVYRYLNTFARLSGIPECPKLLPCKQREAIVSLQINGMAIGAPEDAILIFRMCEDIGVDGALVSPPPIHDAAMATIDLIGKHIVSLVDQDPVHRTTRLLDWLG